MTESERTATRQLVARTLAAGKGLKPNVKPTVIEPAVERVEKLRVPVNGQIVEMEIEAARALRDAISRAIALIDRDLSVDEVRIISLVCSEFQVTERELLSEKRTNHIAQARYVCFWLCRTITDCSLAEIGNRFNRDHGTVMHGFRRIQDEMELNPKMRERVNRLLGIFIQPKETNV